ncbi:MAG: hypothetical protein ACETVU_02110 [Desulfatiglandales bacterium]
MLSDLEYLYTHAWDAFIGKLVIDEVRQPFYDKDGAVNRHEREIRRMLAEHLSIHPRHDISGCLVMMSLVKDAEKDSGPLSIVKKGLLGAGRACSQEDIKKLRTY